MQRGDVEIKYVEFKIEIETMFQKQLTFETQITKLQSEYKQVSYNSQTLKS